LRELADFGQSIWLDNINRAMIDRGDLKSWVDRGLKGLTSNPSIFNQVISRTDDYDPLIQKLAAAGKSTFEIYDELTTGDIRDAADLFAPVYQESARLDGYVSLEINPELANDTEASIREGKRLAAKVGRPNLMIKVPATPAGFPVVAELLAAGINVNVTLIFSLDQYVRTVEAFLKGLARYAQDNPDGDLGKVRSVASVFVSRIDTVVDQLIEDKCQKGDAQLAGLKGKAAVANCRKILERSRELFGAREFLSLKANGAAPQRVLWGSTSTKNPQYSDIKYVAELITPLTVNTVPAKTLTAFLDHGVLKPALTQPVTEAQEVIATLGDQGISVDRICEELLEKGVAAFDDAFKGLLASIEEKARQLSTPAA